MKLWIKNNKEIYDRWGRIIFDGEYFYLSSDLFCKLCGKNFKNGKSFYCFKCQERLRNEAIKKIAIKRYARENKSS